MSESSLEIEDVREATLETYEEWRTVEKLSRDIAFALNQKQTIKEKSAWRDLRAYRDGVDRDDIAFSNYREQREGIRAELAAAQEWVEQQQADLEAEIIDLLRTIVDEQCTDDATLKRQIITIKETLRAEIAGSLIATAIDCSGNYPGRFRWNEETQSVEMREGDRKRLEHRFSPTQKEKIKERDDYKCVNCGGTNELRTHHIVPVDDGGSGVIDNGATLCKACHDELHGFNLGYEYDYTSREDFWSWTHE